MPRRYLISLNALLRMLIYNSHRQRCLLQYFSGIALMIIAVGVMSYNIGQEQVVNKPSINSKQIPAKERLMRIRFPKQPLLEPHQFVP